MDAINRGPATGIAHGSFGNETTAIKENSTLGHGLSRLGQLLQRLAAIDERAREAADRIVGTQPEPVPGRFDGGDAASRGVVEDLHELAASIEKQVGSIDHHLNRIERAL